jgi:hypothetical protein
VELQSVMHVQAGSDGVVSRRSFLQALGVSAGLGVLGWKDSLILRADELRRRGMACILLFLRGGPSQFETFDPKPGTATGGPTRTIQTAVPGIQLAEGWTSLARHMREVALIRSMTNREGEHLRAVYQMHTGYLPTAGIRFPSLGSIVAREIGPRGFDLPHFVSVGERFTPVGSGFLGMAYAPFLVTNANQMPSNAELPRGISDRRFNRRYELMRDLERDFAEAGGQARVRDHRAIYASASRIVRSPRLRAFDLSQESDATRTRYGRTPFGQGCLLARRLVEAGVTFIEVDSDGWDTHLDNFTQTRALSERADRASSALIEDLRQRGRLDRTLVIWMGEFGRTPRINSGNGRDHFPRAFSVALAGGGIRGGQVVGSTNADGTEVANRPIRVPDLFCTFCRALGVNPSRENMTPVGRPVRIVDGGQPIGELFS